MSSPKTYETILVERAISLGEEKDTKTAAHRTVRVLQPLAEDRRLAGLEIARNPAPVRLAQAFFSKDLGEFILPYDAVRTAPDPDAALMAFLQSTYEAAANAAKWDRAALECAVGAIGKPRLV